MMNFSCHHPIYARSRGCMVRRKSKHVVTSGKSAYRSLVVIRKYLKYSGKSEIHVFAPLGCRSFTLTGGNSSERKLVSSHPFLFFYCLLLGVQSPLDYSVQCTRFSYLFFRHPFTYVNFQHNKGEIFINSP